MVEKAEIEAASRERETLPEKIEALETEQANLHRLMGDANFYRQPGDKIAATMERLDIVKRERGFNAATASRP